MASFSHKNGEVQIQDFATAVMLMLAASLVFLPVWTRLLKEYRCGVANVLMALLTISLGVNTDLNHEILCAFTVFGGISTATFGTNVILAII